MKITNTDRLLKLSEVDETIANPDEDIRGRDVKDTNGTDLGTVDDLLIDHDERRVRFLQVASGGFLGIGQDTTLIPVDAITAIDDSAVRVEVSREQVEGAPTYDPALVTERETYGGVLDYYGYGAYWGGGYRYPAYPYYGRV